MFTSSALFPSSFLIFSERSVLINMVRDKSYFLFETDLIMLMAERPVPSSSFGMHLPSITTRIYSRLPSTLRWISAASSSFTVRKSKNSLLTDGLSLMKAPFLLNSASVFLENLTEYGDEPKYVVTNVGTATIRRKPTEYDRTVQKLHALGSVNRAE